MDGSGVSRDDLILSHLHIAESVARKHQRKGDFDELYSEACLGIIYAVDRHLSLPHPNLGGYVYMCADGHARNSLKQSKSGAHVPNNTYKLAQQDLTFDELVESGRSEERARQILNAGALNRTSSIFVQNNDGEDGLIQIEDREESLPDFCMADVKSLLNQHATTQERAAVKMKYGIGCDPMLPSQIAAELGVTASCVAKLIESATEKINRVRECDHCGDTFIRDFHHREYCSSDCYQEHRRQKSIAECKNCKELFLKTHGRLFCTDECGLSFWSEKYKIRGKLVCHCKLCGKEFLSNRTQGHKKHTFCSKACWNEFCSCSIEQERPDFVERITGRKKGTARFIKTRPCKTCGKEMQVNSLGTRKIFCDEECRARHLHPAQTCQQCGRKFYRKIKAKFCTYECSLKFKRENTSLGWENCFVCDTPFKKRKETSAYCSVGCANRHRKMKKDALLSDKKLKSHLA